MTYTPYQEQQIKAKLKERGYSDQQINTYFKGQRSSAQSSSPSTKTAENTQPEEKVSLGKTIIRGIVNPFARVAVTAAGVGGGVKNLAQAVGSKVKGDEEGYKRNIREGMATLNRLEEGVDLGYLGTQKAVTSPKDAVGAGAEAASNFIGAGGVVGVGKTTIKGLIGQGIKQSGKTGFVTGFVGGTGRGLQDNKSVTGAAGQGLLEGTLGGVAGGVLGGTLAVPGAVKRFISPEATDAITRAIKPAKNNSGWDNALKTALPDVAETANRMQVKPKNIEDLTQVTSEAKKSIWGKYAQILGNNKKAVIDGNKIADAMMDTIDKRTRLQNPALVERIQKIADTYRRQIPLDEAEDFLQEANNDLYSYYAKNKVGQKVAVGDPEKAYVVKEAEALRREMYAMFDALGSPEARILKQRWGNLTNFENEILNRKNVAARQNPASLAEQLSFASGIGKVIKSGANMQFGDAIEGTAQIAGARYLKQRNTTDALIETAFNNPLKKTGYVEKAPFVKSTKGAKTAPSLGQQVKEGLKESIPGLYTTTKFTLTYTDDKGKKVMLNKLSRDEASSWTKWLEENGLKYTVKTSGTSAMVYGLKRNNDKVKEKRNTIVGGVQR